MSAPEHVVVIGASAAGLGAADGLREAGYTGSITVLGAERHRPYDRPTLSKALLAGQGAPELLELRSPERIAANRLDLRLGHAAVGLDVDRKFVVTTYGEAIPWDAVVIACGSRPRRLRSVTGQPLPVLRTPEDLHALRQAAAHYGAISVIGTGFIGLEIAAGLVDHGVEVTVFGDTSLPMEPVLGPQVAAVMRDLHLARGVRLKMSTPVQSIAGEPGDYELHLADGSVHRTPFVLAGVGVDPDVDWLIGSGVALDGGILTDAAGQTNVPGVWAAGDVARSHHPMFNDPLRVEHWTHAVEKGRHIGLNIARATTDPFRGVPYFWTDQYGRRFHCYGRRHPSDDMMVVHGSLTDEEFLVLHGSNDALHAVFASGCAKFLRGYRKLLERGATWGEALELARTTKPDLQLPAVTR